MVLNITCIFVSSLNLPYSKVVYYIYIFFMEQLNESRFQDYKMTILMADKTCSRKCVNTARWRKKKMRAGKGDKVVFIIMDNKLCITCTVQLNNT